MPPPVASTPPLLLRCVQDWEREFARYKTFPEWQQRKSMTLDEFKVRFEYPF